MPDLSQDRVTRYQADKPNTWSYVLGRPNYKADHPTWLGPDRLGIGFGRTRNQFEDQTAGRSVLRSRSGVAEVGYGVSSVDRRIPGSYKYCRDRPSPLVVDCARATSPIRPERLVAVPTVSSSTRSWVDALSSRDDVWNELTDFVWD